MSLDVYDEANQSPAPGPAAARPYVSILFDCCKVYARVYRQPNQPFYEGRCPKCLRPVHLRVGPDGVSTRFFRAE